MALWDDELTITPEYLQVHTVFKACRGNSLLGNYSFRSKDAQTMLMDNLFVEPEYIGQQVGNRLMTHFLRLMTEKQIHRILLHADPHAMRFYLQYGFDVIGQLPTSIPGRFLPTMSLDLDTE
ncbi:MAG: GNAT family N-acetyltransferase [Saprospiraceae bacterium]|nr:GNAT family N-acetyltransferase [Saprospiraceae bacterium]